MTYSFHLSGNNDIANLIFQEDETLDCIRRNRYASDVHG